jgi:hypothetical protein
VNFQKIVSDQDSHNFIEIYVICDHFTEPFGRTLGKSGMKKLIPKSLVVEVGE